MKQLLPITTENARLRKFNDIILIFKENASLPIAYRSPISHVSPHVIPECSEVLLDFDRFVLFGNGKEICLSYRGSPCFHILVSPLDGEADTRGKTIGSIKSYLAAAYDLDPHIISRTSAISVFEELVSQVAYSCGCLTDISREGGKESEYEFHGGSRTNRGFLALALPITALMYRRISALRGFNFRVSFSESLPCLGFSAKVLLDGESPKLSDIPEYSALCEIAESDSLIIAARLTVIAEEDGETIHKLSVVICPQEIDPSGVFRAPELIKKKESFIESVDFDIPGKY